MDFDFKNWLISEMPITKFSLQGKWRPEDKPYRYDQQSIGILTNPKGVEKIHKKWSNTKNNFELYFIKAPGASRFVQIGQVTPEWIKENLKVDIQPNPEAITVVFTNNIGVEKMPLTAWTIAHRLGHALYREKDFGDYFFSRVQKDFDQLVSRLFPNQRSDYSYGYGSSPPPKNQVRPEHIAMAVGTMKSARDRTLFRFGEFVFELFAQYLITGKIKFNPLPRSIMVRNRMAWGRPNPDTKYSQANDDQLKAANAYLDNCADNYNSMLETILDGFEGNIYVM